MIQRLNCCHCFCFHRLTATVYQRTSRIRVVADFNHGVTELRQRRRSVSVSRAATQHRRRRDAAILLPLRKVYTFDLSTGVYIHPVAYRVSQRNLTFCKESLQWKLQGKDTRIREVTRCEKFHFEISPSQRYVHSELRVNVS